MTERVGELDLAWIPSNSIAAPRPNPKSPLTVHTRLVSPRYIGMDKRNLDRQKRLLLEKRSEITIARAEAESPIPAAGGWEGDQIDQANADAEAELQIHLHQTNLRLLRAIEGALARIRNGIFGTYESCQNPNPPSTVGSCALGATMGETRSGRTSEIGGGYCRKDRFDRRLFSWGRQFRFLVHRGRRPRRWDVTATISTERDQISSERIAGSLGRSYILRCRAVGISAPIESGIAINAAERTDSDCAQEIPLRGPATMRSKYLGTPAIGTGPFGVRAHNQSFPTIILEIMHG